ncbi:BadF/BadG/BcrA/BcrD ATPase family protein [Alteromonas gracilis]|uniref:BadF/BadG/BcrA/BcrD ATPase family protein n=1 Tax=Alteromonas gracilis TaxID=1479524 RepID=UPI003735FFFB
MSSDLFFIGIDGGGTKCRARLEDSNGKLLGEGISGPANIMRDCELAKASTLEAISIAINAANASVGVASSCECGDGHKAKSGASQATKRVATKGVGAISLSQCVVGAGVAGANIASAKQEFEAWSHPFHSMHVISDLHAACLGAHDGKEGAAIIIGTGSTGTLWKNNAFNDVGGHGFPIGDKASGAWLGLKAVQHTLLCLDGLEPMDSLATQICAALQSSDTDSIVSQCATFNTHHYAALVEHMLPLLYTKHARVLALFQEGAQYIERMAGKLLTEHSHGLAMIGGLSNVYSTYFSDSVKARLVACKTTPQEGAIYCAKAAYYQLKGEK